MAATHTDDTATAWPLLRALQTLGVCVRVDVGVERQLPSFVLEVDGPSDRITLDLPRTQVVAPGKGDIASFEARAEGRRLVFRTTVEAVESRGEARVMVCREPELLLNEQRRSAFRVAVSSDQHMQAEIRGADGEPFQGQILDISRLGFGASIREALAADQGSVVHCQLRLPDMNLEVDAQVRHCVQEDDSTRLGLEFEALAPAIEDALTRVVFQLQRHALRRRASEKPQR